jgi:uncharacterized protein
MIPRPDHIRRVTELVAQFPVVAIIGARQVGKTTLAQQIADQADAPVTRFDLEDPADLARLEVPALALESIEGLVVLDEIQRLPEIFPVLRVLVDRDRRPARFLVLGSASPELLRQSSESLAGRIAYHHLPGIRVREVAAERIDELWIRGGFPRSLLAEDEKRSQEWRRQFIRTFLERDLPALGIRTAPETMRRFWQMLAHYHGQVWNGAELARAFGVSSPTIRHYLDLLTGAFAVRQLQPWHENLSKRQVKSPKVYVADSGILHTLLGVDSMHDLLGHPKIGASWEGFMIEQILAQISVRDLDCYFWATHTGAELDLLIPGPHRIGFEIKRTDAPRVTKSMRIARDDLKLDELVVVHAGEHSWPMEEGIRAVSARKLATDLNPN